MTIVNADVVTVFASIANLLEVQGASPFRIRAWRNAARSVGELGRSVAAMVEAGEALDQLCGIGPDPAGTIGEIVATGTCEQLERLREELPPAITELLAIPRLGPRRVRTLYQELGVKTAADLLRCARIRRIRMVPGFGPKMERLILEAVTARVEQQRRPAHGVTGVVVSLPCTGAIAPLP